MKKKKRIRIRKKFSDKLFCEFFYWDYICGVSCYSLIPSGLHYHIHMHHNALRGLHIQGDGEIYFNRKFRGFRISCGARIPCGAMTTATVIYNDYCALYSRRHKIIHCSPIIVRDSVIRLHPAVKLSSFVC